MKIKTITVKCRYCKLLLIEKSFYEEKVVGQQNIDLKDILVINILLVERLSLA